MINIITNAALIPTLLQNGAVIASVFSELVTNAVQFIYMKKKVKFSINKKTFELKIEGNPDTKVKFAIPSNVRLPQYDGHVFIAASELEQDFDMEGDDN